MDDLERTMLRELHDAIIGSAARPGLAEQVRNLDSRVARLEGLVSKAGATLWDKAAALAAGAVAGYVGSHFPGTRP